MTRRALRPRISDGAGRAPARPTAAALPWGLFGSITVLIFGCLSRARGGREACQYAVKKRPAHTSRRRLLGSCCGYCGWLALGSEKVLCRAGQKRAPRRRGSTSFQAERSIHTSLGAVNSLTQYIAFVF